MQGAPGPPMPTRSGPYVRHGAGIARCTCDSAAVWATALRPAKRPLTVYALYILGICLMMGHVIACRREGPSMQRLGLWQLFTLSAFTIVAMQLNFSIVPRCYTWVVPFLRVL